MDCYLIEESLVYFPLKKALVRFKDAEKIDQKVKRFLESDIWNELRDYTTELLRRPDPKLKYSDIHAYSIGIIPTNECNLRCIYCYSETGEVKKRELTFAQVDQILNMIIKNAIIHKLGGNRSVECKITFCGGGEPTFNWNLFSYCVEELKRKGKENNIETSILLITNGFLNNNQIVFISENVEQINISMDGPANIQNKQRPTVNGGFSYDIVDNTIKRLADNGRSVYVRSTIVPDNFGRLTDFADFFFQEYSNIEVLHLEPLFEVGRGKNINTSKCHLRQFMNGYVEAYDYVKRKYDNKRLYNSSFSYQLLEYGCGAAIGLNPWVHMDGKILPCTEYIKSEESIVGIVSNEGIKFNNDFSSLAKITSKCKNCFAFYHCAGGCCRNILQDDDGNMLTEYAEQFCDTTKEFWRRVFADIVCGRSVCGMWADELRLEGQECVEYIYLIRTEK